MKIRIDNLYEINTDKLHIETVMTLPESVNDPQIVAIEPISITVDITKAKEDQYRVRGELHTTVEMICSNCLDKLQTDVVAQIDELFVEADSDLSNLYEEDQENCNYIVGQEFDLNPFIRQEILLVLPMKPLCKETCKGLCPECGVNKNKQACACKTERIDPRLAGLADLFKENSSD